MKNLLVVTACLAGNTKQIERLQESCEFNKLDFAYYGVKERFVNWYDAKIVKLAEFLKTKESEYKYVVYTDGFDSWALKDEQTILDTFNSFNTRLVIAGETNNYPLKLDREDYETPFRYPCAGQFMGETKTVIDALEVMKTNYSNIDIPDGSKHNDQALWQIYCYREGIRIDHKAKLFLSAGSLPLSKLCFTNDEVTTPLTKNSPCFIHFNGPKGGSENERNMDMFYDLWLDVREKYA